MTLGIFDGRGLGAVPSKWWPDARVKQLQTLLNPELVRLGCSTQLKTDGLIGPGTCGALKFVDDAAVLTRQAPSAALVKLITDNAADFGNACANVGALTMPSCPAPKAPTTTTTQQPAQPTFNDVIVMQSLMNDEVLKKKGFSLVPENGKLDALTCGTASAMYADVKASRVTVSAELKRLLTASAIINACGSHQPWVVAKQISAPAPAPTVTSPPPPAPVTTTAPKPTVPAGPDYSQCWIDYGNKTQAVREMETLINARLAAKGYHPIPKLGTWNAQMCGAMSVLKNQYDKWPIKACPGGVVVPLRCPTSIPPIKKAVPVAVKPPAPTPVVPAAPVPARAGVLGIGLAAVAATAAALYAKKKGLF